MANSISIASPTSKPLTKRQKLTHHHQRHKEEQEEEEGVIPGIHDHAAQLCLSLLHPSTLYSVCHSWRRLLYSPSFPPFLSLYTLFSSHSNTNHSDSIHFLSFDPISSQWLPLPPPPSDPPLHLLLRHPSFLSRNLPIQSLAVSGCLILLAGTTNNFFPALSRPLVFNPLSQSWSFGPPLAPPRRWCAAGALRGAVYVASGIGSHYSAEVAKSAEKWELTKKKSSSSRSSASATNYLINNSHRMGWRWEKMEGLKDGRFSRDAIDAVGWRGKLCMVNVKGNSAKEGIVYDVEEDRWQEMPEGMVGGWSGPVAAMDEEEMYVVDEVKGALSKYDVERDYWEEILESERLKGAQQVAAGGGRVCVVCGGGRIVVVDVVAKQPRLWLVEPPPGLEAMAVHILPRMSRPDMRF